MNPRLSRRTFPAGATAAGLGSASKAPELRAETSKIHDSVNDSSLKELCFMNQYYDGWMNIAKGIRDTQIKNIATAM